MVCLVLICKYRQIKHVEIAEAAAAFNSDHDPGLEDNGEEEGMIRNNEESYNE